MLRNMAAPVGQIPFASRPYRDDPHWKKLKASIYDSDHAKALEILADYKYKEIDDKLDQFLLKLIDEGNFKAMYSLASVMRTAKKTTDFSIVCHLGAGMQLKKLPLRGSRNLPFLAEVFAREFRTYSGAEWKARAAFMDTIVATKDF
jgi:hypothetical protein